MSEHALSRGKASPYVPWPSFKTLVADLHEHKMPSRIDRSVLKRFSGITGTQLMTAMRFLGLINDKNEPTQRLHDLVEAYETPEWSPRLLDILKSEYAPIFGLDLGTATHSHFDETFRRAFPGADSVLRKSVSFFLGAAKEAGVVISDRVLHGRKPRAANIERPRRSKSANGADQSREGEQAAQDAQAVQPHNKPAAFEAQLLAKFPSFDPAWPDDIKTKWFDGFQQFMGIAKGQPKTVDGK